MNGKNKYPFYLENVILRKIDFFRGPEIINPPDNFELIFRVDVKVSKADFPKKIQINMRLVSKDDPNIKITMEIVGIFRLIKDTPEPDEDVIPAFVNERAMFILWPYIVQQKKHIFVVPARINPSLSRNASSAPGARSMAIPSPRFTKTKPVQVLLP